MAPSLPPLRSWRSTIYAPSTQSSNFANLEPVESPASISHRLASQAQHHHQQQSYEKSVTELRRRLARKASTFSLRGKNRRSQRYLAELGKADEQQQVTREEEKEKEHSETSSVVTVTGKKEVKVKQEVVGPSANPGIEFKGPLATFAARFRNKYAPLPFRSHTSVSMASETSPPPVPFARLQMIATEACDSILSPATSYVHASTAEWNTGIIDNILQKLVKETTTESMTQPQYKYIVNSTIIQHAVGGDGARRGMHAASGAYWNNEKDGMWSFKYEAAEGKGLDVVVGIIWVWLG